MLLRHASTRMFHKNQYGCRRRLAWHTPTDCHGLILFLPFYCKHNRKGIKFRFYYIFSTEPGRCQPYDGHHLLQARSDDQGGILVSNGQHVHSRLFGGKNFTRNRWIADGCLCVWRRKPFRQLLNGRKVLLM